MRTAAAFFLISALAAAGAGPVRLGDVVMVTPGNELLPSGVVASVSQISVLAAQSAANAQAAALLQQGMAETEEKCAAFEAMLQAREGTIWIEAFNVWRIGEKSMANTNITAEVVRFDPRYGSDDTNWFNRVYTFFNEDPGYDPFVRVGRSLGPTNTWESAYVSNVYFTNLVVGSTYYENLTVTEFATPKAWSNAFFRVGSEVRGSSTNMFFFPVNNGVAVKGETPLTLTAVIGTNQLRIVGGIVCVPK